MTAQVASLNKHIQLENMRSTEWAVVQNYIISGLVVCAFFLHSSGLEIAAKCLAFAASFVKGN